ncbi:hypothetical protein [Spiroplasma taiwanense]|uniref:Uncharacterized protein n=1 Tax=Spiroplasma taiwanense CT-1 TaxID=1276220 RepID=S5LWK4_9MOLU|nr:hypothetical protein [Spiroplasma taiwanense]AGR41016.1 hypothetical protein STAIW_v1c03580 [Spiroplasma taiwanense CT-1]
MKSSIQIKKDLASQGYIWTPNYKDILEKVWAHTETYFDDDEKVLSALWASFKRYDEQMVGVVFITSKRTFTLEVVDNNINSQIRYLPFDSYSLQKIQLQLSKTDNALSYVSLQNDSFGNGITFGTPNKKVAQHFVDTLRSKTNGKIEILPESDNPLLAENEKEQLIDEDLNKAKQVVPHKFEEKHEEIKPMKEHDGWRKAPVENKDKEVEIKIVPPKKPLKDKKIKATGYAKNWKSKMWLLWFILPISLISITLALIFIFYQLK